MSRNVKVADVLREGVITWKGKTFKVRWHRHKGFMYLNPVSGCWYDLPEQYVSDIVWVF